MITFDTSVGDYTQVGLTKDGVFHTCVTDGKEVLTSETLWFDTSISPDRTGVVVYSAQNEVQVGSGEPTNLGFIIGRVGTDVAGIAVVLEDGTLTEGRIDNGWFAIDRASFPTGNPMNIEIQWTLDDARTTTAVIADLFPADQ